jgi:hypothetical protein
VSKKNKKQNKTKQKTKRRRILGEKDRTNECGGAGGWAGEDEEEKKASISLLAIRLMH